MKSISARRWFHRAVSLALIPMMTGCTAVLWAPALQTTASEPEVAGIVRNYPAKGDRALVVLYRAHGDGTDVNLVVPLSADDSPVAPFAPAGTAYIVKYPDSPVAHPTAGKVSDDQIAAILSREKLIRDERAGLAAHFNSADWTPVAGPRLQRMIYGPDQTGTLCLLAFRTNDAGQIEAVAPDQIGNGKPSAIVLPAGVHLVLVPKDVDRPPGDRARDVVVATAVTPLSVAADAAGAGIVTGLVIGAIGIAIPVAIVTYPFVPHPANSAPSNAQAKRESDEPITLPVYVGHSPTVEKALNSIRAITQQWPQQAP